MSCEIIKRIKEEIERDKRLEALENLSNGFTFKILDKNNIYIEDRDFLIGQDGRLIQITPTGLSKGDWRNYKIELSS